MAERTRKTTRKQKLLGNHQKCWIWGKNVVLETLRAGRWPILELRLADRLARPKRAEARQLAESRDVPVIVDTADELARRCGSSEHQGYLAKMPPFPYDDTETLLHRKMRLPLYLVLDSIQDPYNFGAVLRCAEVFGVDAVFVAEQGQAEVTSLVARTSAGAVNHLRIARVEKLADLLRRLRTAKVSVVAATQHGSTDVGDFDFRTPAAVVIGNEGEGIAAPLLDQCDAAIRIPQRGLVGSLNAAVAAGIVLYEAARVRGRNREEEMG